MVFGLLSVAGFYLTTGQVFNDAKILHKEASEFCCVAATEGEKQRLVNDEQQAQTNGTFREKALYGGICCNGI